jgi:GNAT superfamily N-acetyltransferase
VRTSLRIERRAERDPDVRAAQAAYLAEIARRFGRPLDPWNQGAVAPALSLLVVDGRRPVGCGALRQIEADVGEIKRMWLHPDVRGLGLGARLLAALESAARQARQRELRLDTNERLGEAIALYEAAGYRRIERYNDNPDATHFYAKAVLTVSSRASSRRSTTTGIPREGAIVTPRSTGRMR